MVPGTFTFSSAFQDSLYQGSLYFERDGIGLRAAPECRRFARVPWDGTCCYSRPVLSLAPWLLQVRYCFLGRWPH
jgi:hypothetical protein